ncbi:3-dehydroquinate synthase [Dissulfurirhabdus thermomarina]|uniref:3-dehydroquinate synthase n=1 Tax=Dissulfurirhabdus thermomarina TaxID=1765737 RepID=A0A6N9TLV4_DISTH|nr:3-dehydroquinate synthase [Dissulfurirhabdus thermomarina]NDY42215.1 3-dehydroquinate synthase [Dissulfurirhabdus thermomarina]NMX24120.1 3-dehydroquinate synthase [Dissulfurirhabdus thermomarina]
MKTMGDLSAAWERVRVELGAASYDILIGPGLLAEVGGDLRERPLGHRYVVVTDETVADYLGADLERLLRDEGLRVDLLSFPAGEASKHMGTVVDLARRMVALGCDRRSVVLALGGGVVGDVAGFLASIYMRGVPCIQLPTTLLAQVDSSVGGKTGVDLPEGKNLVGTFYQPRRVYADIGALASLPPAELRNGLAEVVKYGMIRSPELFALLEARGREILDLEPETVAEVVARSCRIKAEVVAADEREGGLRRILNFGHTVGHAVEAASDYRLPHGSAVAVGMAVIARLSVEMGLMPPADEARLLALLDALGLPRRVPDGIETGHLLELLRHDKKADAGRVHFVLSEGIGATRITPEVDEAALAGAVDATRSAP